MMHEDYLDYLHRSESTYSVGLAYLLKWFALFVVSAIYYLINFPPKRKIEKKITAEKVRGAEPVTAAGAAEDPFAKIRSKQKLDGRGDKILKN